MSDSGFAVKVIYNAGKTYAIRMGGRKYNFKQFKPTDVTDRSVAQKFDRMPGFSVKQIAGELWPEDEAPVSAPVKKKLLPKKRKKKSDK